MDKLQRALDAVQHSKGLVSLSTPLVIHVVLHLKLVQHVRRVWPLEGNLYVCI